MINFEIKESGRVSGAFLALGLRDFEQACLYVRALPYGRNSSRADRLLVLHEGKGTCSGKHALLAELAAEQRRPLELVLGFFEMTGRTTPAVREVMERHGLDCLPELHTYLRLGSERFDFTGIENPITPQLEFIYEEAISPAQVEAYKTELHQRFLAGWLSEEGLSSRFSAADLWQIREECIAARSAGRIALL